VYIESVSEKIAEIKKKGTGENYTMSFVIVTPQLVFLG
jgi:hypothetical protein